MLGIRFPEMEVAVRHGIQQGVFVRRRLGRVSICGYQGSFVVHWCRVLGLRFCVSPGANDVIEVAINGGGMEVDVEGLDLPNSW